MSAYAGDGFEVFVEEEIPRLLKIALLVGAQDADAWDLVQETLIRLGARWSQLSPSGSRHAYARKALLNLHVSRWRRFRRHVSLGPRLDRPMEIKGFETVETRDVLLPALRRLPVGQRAVVVLRYFDDCTEAEAAAALGCSIGTVKSQHSRALRTLRRMLESPSESVAHHQPLEDKR